MMIKKNIILHPWLFALIPIIGLFEHNQDIATAYYLPKPIIISLLGTSLVFFILNHFLKNKYKSSIISSILVISFFTFSLLFNLFFSINPYLGLGLIFYQSLTVLIYIIILIAVSSIVASSNYKLDNSNKLLNMFAATVLILQLLNIANYQYQHSSAVISKINFDQKQEKIEEISIKDSKGSPDIYYIVLDGYGRQDVLEDVYNYDNSDFINFLKEKGFFVAEESTSNYNQTFLSLVSTLNLDYLDDVATTVGYESGDRSVLKKLLKNNLVHNFYKEQGYTFVSLPSTWSGTYKNIKSDIHLANNLEQNNFDALLIKKTPLVLFFPNTRVKYMATYLNNALDKIPEIAAIKKPTFSYIHVLSPHPPFIFKSDGDIANVTTNCMDGTDGSWYFNVCPGVEKYQTQYIGQLSYLNKRFETIINKILEESETPPIIILQSDHGPGSMLDWDNVDNSNIFERMSILNAYYVPEETKKMLYPTITPVNTFRILFNSMFNANFEILEDKNYFALWNKPYKFIDVTDQVK